jgi:isoleucyl-tRNA synthetase
LAPVISFTAEEIWKAMPHKASDKMESVFLNDMSAYDEKLAADTAAMRAKWEKVFEYRDDVMKALELARANKMIGKSLDAKVTVYTEDEGKAALLESFGDTLSTILIVSETKVVKSAAPEGAFAEGEGGLGVVVEVADGCKCDRCWMHTNNGKATEDGGFICYRCDLIVNG